MRRFQFSVELLKFEKLASKQLFLVKLSLKQFVLQLSLIQFLVIGAREDFIKFLKVALVKYRFEIAPLKAMAWVLSFPGLRLFDDLRKGFENRIRAARVVRVVRVDRVTSMGRRRVKLAAAHGSPIIRWRWAATVLVGHCLRGKVRVVLVVGVFWTSHLWVVMTVLARVLMFMVATINVNIFTSLLLAVV